MKRYIFLTVALAATLGTFAESHPTKAGREGRVNVIGGDTLAAESAYKNFAEISPAAFNVPDAPRFAFVGKDRKFYLGIGGSVKGTVSYDFGDPIDNANEFTTSAIPMNPAPGNDGLVQLSAMQSSLFMNFIALPDNPNRVGVYIQGNFLGNNAYGFQLQYAYAKWRGLTVGYDYSLFTDVAAAPPTIDYEGPNAFTAIPNGVVDYRHSFTKNLSAGLGVELPQASYTNSSATSTVNQRVPDIPAYLQWNFGPQSWIRFSGLVRNIEYRDVLAAKNRNVTGWGIKASGSASISNLTLYYQATYGKGMASYIQDLNSLGMDLMPSATKAGKLDAVKTWGGYVGMQYNFSPKLYASVTYSHVRAYADQYAGGQTAWSDQYKYAQYAVGNVFYNINSLLIAGVEYIWGHRVDMSGVSHHDSRIQAMLQVNF